MTDDAVPSLSDAQPGLVVGDLHGIVPRRAPEEIGFGQAQAVVPFPAVSQALSGTKRLLPSRLDGDHKRPHRPAAVFETALDVDSDGVPGTIAPPARSLQ